MLRKSKAGVGIHVALAIMAPPKGKASTDVNPQAEPTDTGENNVTSATAPPNLTGRWDFSRLFTVEAQPQIVGDAEESVQKMQHIAHNAWDLTVKAAKSESPTNSVKAEIAATPVETFTPKPMTYEEARLWLQAFNAGPYACLKYEGNVPYQETRDYVPRVMKNYEQDLKTDYDAEINAAAGKYGLDPQMIRAIMKTESDFQNQCVSHAGARGLMQVMPVVWKDVKEKYNLDWDYSQGVFEPQKNIEVACAYLAWLRYDFLPRHFDAYEANPAAPVCLVRDRDRGVPDRESPRIIVKGMDAVPADTVVASLASAAKGAASELSDKNKSEAGKAESHPQVDVAKAEAKDIKPSVGHSASSDNVTKAEKPKIEVTDVDSGKIVKRVSGNGKTQVVMRGTGKAISISVGAKGKVVTKDTAASKATVKLAGRSDEDDNKDRKELTQRKRTSIAKADAKERDSQGG